MNDITNITRAGVRKIKSFMRGIYNKRILGKLNKRKILRGLVQLILVI